MKKIELHDVEFILRETFPTATFNVPALDLKLGDIEEWEGGVDKKKLVDQWKEGLQEMKERLES